MNVTYDEKTKILTIRVTLEAPRPSASGKSNILYTSGGFMALESPAGAKANLTIITSR